MLRNIVKVKQKDHVRTADVFEKTKTKGVGGTIKKLKLDYDGHIAKESYFKWNKVVTMWTPLRDVNEGGQRRVGRMRLSVCLFVCSAGEP